MSIYRKQYVDVMKDWLNFVGQKEAAEAMTTEEAEIDENVKQHLAERDYLFVCNCCTYHAKDLNKMHFHKQATNHDYRIKV
jgi:hypothetical protein